MRGGGLGGDEYPPPPSEHASPPGNPVRPVPPVSGFPVLLLPSAVVEGEREKERMGVRPALHDRERGGGEKEGGWGSRVFTCKLHLPFPDRE